MGTVKRYAAYTGVIAGGVVFVAAGAVAWAAVQVMAYSFLSIPDRPEV